MNWKILLQIALERSCLRLIQTFLRNASYLFSLEISQVVIFALIQTDSHQIIVESCERKYMFSLPHSQQHQAQTKYPIEIVNFPLFFCLFFQTKISRRKQKLNTKYHRNLIGIASESHHFHNNIWVSIDEKFRTFLGRTIRSF